ncbi:hypothetical protein D0962_37870 [Leptolyngbyaceae cyanobacterium CCMR0082]|uniref:Uncharacterized protein n=1 Tax=Adonisia turfae CCMR0082 TaxID=2304604 RepID=A0A6M0SKQ4_9CYAN|nr:HAD-IG family 5'-nucleotidase [Adonisia turfae]NEZ68421.1 hypothetical protein [Adonisia turfae CCMR0082]
MNTITDEQRRLAGAMGVDPDDPLITVLKPVADLAEEMKAWKDIDIELLKFLRSTSQGVEQTASNYAKLANYYRTLVELSKESSTQMQTETGKLVMLMQDSIRQMQSDLPSKQELKSDLSHLKNEIQQTKALSADKPFQWGPLILAALLSMMTGWMGWRMGRVDGFQKGELEIMNLFGGRTNMFYWQRMRMENSDVVKHCRDQQQQKCTIELP